MSRRPPKALPVSPVTPPIVRTREARRIPLDQVYESPLNPRKRSDDRDLEDLAASIRLHDVIEPIVVRESAFELGRYEIVAGSRRFRASKLAGAVDIPAIVRDVDDMQLLEIALAENVHRRSMHVLDEAEALAKLQQLDRVYQDLEVLAAKVGRSATYVRDRLRLLALAPVVVDALDAGAITIKHAELIATAAPDQHTRALEECFASMLTIGTHGYVPRAKAIADREWSALKDALMGTRDLDAWIRQWGKQDVKADAVQDVLRPAVAADVVTDEQLEADEEIPVDIAEEALAAATSSYLQLSEKGGYQFNASKAKAAGVISRDAYKVVATEKARCKYTKRGIIVHPATATPRVLEVCVSRVCSKHYPKPTASRAPAVSATAKAQIAQRAAEEKREHEAFEAAQPQLIAALVKHVLALKPTAKVIRQLFVRREWMDFSLKPDALKRAEKHVRLTDASGFAVCLLAMVDLERDSERWLLEDVAARVGFDLAAWLKKHAAPPAPASGSSAKKASVKKGAKKR